MRTVFVFFGHPGAGKTTLCARFGALHGVPALDTDTFLTPGERAAAENGTYTQEMRLANIRRYCEWVRTLPDNEACICLADILPNQEARRTLRDELAGMRVVFIWVQTPPELWRRRLNTRSGNMVDVGFEAAEAYLRQHWQDPEAGFDHVVIVNGEDASATDRALLALYDARGHRRPPRT